MSQRRVCLQLHKTAMNVLCRSLQEPMIVKPRTLCGVAVGRGLHSKVQWDVWRGTMRTFASKAVDDDSGGLKSILTKESEHERSTYVPPEELCQGPPEPFTLTEMQGDTLMTLTRSYGSDETVSVDIMIQDDLNQDEPVAFEDEDTGEIDIDVSVDFIVTVSKRGSKQELVFECSSDGSFMEIQRVSLEPEDEDEVEEGMYTGPVFDELDDAVQEALYAYLEERGITPEIGEYLLHLIHDKEQREYMDWLDKMTSFL